MPERAHLVVVFKSRSQQQRIRSRAGLHILVPGPDGEPFAQRKSRNVVALRR
jgi:hypothetical protein